VSQPATPEPLPREPGAGDLRASDEDRQAVVDRLRRALDEGRLDLAEFDDRTSRAYAARTYAELDRLTFDLPTGSAAGARLPAVAPVAWGRPRRRFGASARAWLIVSLVSFVVWLITDLAATVPVYPWWIWVAGPWGALLLARRFVR
jgi:Domain of unknown function (DUF1707)